MRIVLTGGGTGGHVLPFESIIEAIRTIHTKEKDTLPSFLDAQILELFFLGVSSTEIDELFKRYDIPVTHIPSGKMRRYASTLNIIDLLFRLPLGITIALWRMWQIMPDVVVSKGGYGSIPTVLSAVVYRVPILLHESDVVPGSANKILMQFAHAITIGFSVSRQYLQQFTKKLFVTGTPVRLALLHSNKQAAKQIFGFDKTKPMLLVMGGSQGAKQINEGLLAILPNIIGKMSVLHITGSTQHDLVTKVASEILTSSAHASMYKSVPYLGETMVSALVAADVVVSRAGASSLAEIARLRVPSLLIPLATSANDHQRKNSLAFEAAGAALVLDPTNVSPHLLEQGIIRLVTDAALRETLSKNLEVLDFPNAATDIAALVFQLASGFRPI
ncbi:MAG: UDP-N-acetylglucosamine--N-acetylmuramyl-(pentapeptide) pyrophosphoryl-undecaprenol N-acetylglucosamine transferase [bacterium]|nr:UDP-N-acetylglucosamine--N-acetylmuramyl-(pentapeptide) pyrophosphoryl-undecaprenol N-acetylglucosamine transferase [bacterium]